MRLLVDASTAQPGGGVQFLLQQLVRLQDRGVHLVVICNPSTDPIFLAAELRTYPLSPLGHTRRLLLTARLVRKLRRDFDVIYSPSSYGPITAVLPYVVCIQNPHLFARPRVAEFGLRFAAQRLLSWLTIGRSRGVVHLSKVMAEDFELATGLGIPQRVIYSGPGGIHSPGSETSTDPRGDANGAEVILSVSNLYRYKRIDILIKALAEEPLRARDCRLVVAGSEYETGLRDSLLDLARRLDVSHRVMLLGGASPSSLARLYSTAAIYASCSEREAFPLTPAEALQYGLPVVLNGQCPGFREIYGDIAVFVERNTAKEFALALAVGLERGRTKDHARKFQAFLGRFSWDANASQLYEVLTEASRYRRSSIIPKTKGIQGIWTFAKYLIGTSVARP